MQRGNALSTNPFSDTNPKRPPREQPNAPLLPAVGEEVLAHAYEGGIAEWVGLHADHLQRWRLPWWRRLCRHHLQHDAWEASRMVRGMVRRDASQDMNGTFTRPWAAHGAGGAHVLCAVPTCAALHRGIKALDGVGSEAKLGVKQSKYVGAGVACTGPGQGAASSRIQRP